MSKVYFCKNEKDGTICGKTCPEAFQKGRYSICKECKNEYHKKYNKQFYEMKKQDTAIPIIERMNEGIGKLGDNANELFRRIIENEPLPSIGIAIPAKFDIVEKNFNDNLNFANEEIGKLKKENETLRSYIQSLIKKLSSTESLLNNVSEKLDNLDNYIKFKDNYAK